MRLRRPPALARFVLSALGSMVALTLLWSHVSPWTSYPVAALSHIALEHGAPMWVRSVRKSPGAMEVETTLEVPVPEAGGRLAEISVEADPGRHAYGLPLFLALLLAARGPGRLARALGGYVLLLPAQAFSLTLYVLMQMVLSAQASARVLKVPQWQLEAIVYGYQVGALVLPTLAPIVLWICLDQRFFNDVVLRGWRAEAQPPLPASAAPPATQPQPQPQPQAAQTKEAPARRPVEISRSSAATLPPQP